MKLELAPATREVFDELCQTLLPMAREVAIAPFHYQTAREAGWRTLSEGMTFIVRDDRGPIVGTVGMVKAPIWYALWPDHYMLTDSWFYVAPAYRGSRAAATLTIAVRDLGRQLDKPTFIRVVNPNKAAKLMRLV